MLQVVNIKVRSVDLDYLELSWEVASTPEDVLDYTFQVLRSETASGPYRPITPAFENRFRYRDNEADQLSKHLWYYKVRLTHKESASTQDFPEGLQGVVQLPDLNLEALEAARRIKLALRKFSGRKVWVFPVRSFGQTCDCFDSSTGRRTRSQCERCYDTGCVGGYYAPIGVFAQIGPTIKSSLITVPNSIYLANFPLLQPGDLVVEGENKRWKVTEVRVRERLRAVVYQRAGLVEVPRADIEYRLPVQELLAGHGPSPESTFRDRQTL